MLIRYRFHKGLIEFTQKRRVEHARAYSMEHTFYVFAPLFLCVKLANVNKNEMLD